MASDDASCFTAVERHLECRFFVQEKFDSLANYASLRTFGHLLLPFRSLCSLSLHTKTRKVVNTCGFNMSLAVSPTWVLPHSRKVLAWLNWPCYPTWHWRSTVEKNRCYSTPHLALQTLQGIWQRRQNLPWANGKTQVELTIHDTICFLNAPYYGSSHT